jgi:hypothetical protein
MTSVEIPSCTFRYRELPADVVRDPRRPYRLEAIEQRRRTVRWTTRCIERSSLAGQDLVQLQLFNEVFLEEANAESLRFTFISLTGEERTFAPSAQTTRLLPVRQEAEEVAELHLEHSTRLPTRRISPRMEDADLDSFYSASVYSLLYHYVEMRARETFFLVGLMLVPCSTLFIPLWLNGQLLTRLLSDWRGSKLPKSKREALVTVATVVHQSEVTATTRHVQAREREKRHELGPRPPPRDG